MANLLYFNQSTTILSTLQSIVGVPLEYDWQKRTIQMYFNFVTLDEIYVFKQENTLQKP